MALISWSYRPPDKVAPGTLSFGWTLASADVEVRWYTAPIQNEYPKDYLIGTTQAQVTVQEPGVYVFHLEARDRDGNTEERVILFEVSEESDQQDAPQIFLTSIPSIRKLRPLHTAPREVPFRGKPDSHEENRWIQNAVEDLRELHAAADNLLKEVGMRTRVSIIERVAQEALRKQERARAIARHEQPFIRTIEVSAEEFTPGVPSAAGEQSTEAVVDRIFGEIAPTLIAEPENKIGWPTRDGLRLPSTLSVATAPMTGAIIQTDPKQALDGRPDTAWIREIQHSAAQAPEDTTFTVVLPSGINATRVANRLDISCLPAFGVDIRSVKLYNGKNWTLVPGWPRLGTGSGIASMPLSQVGTVRLRFPDQQVSGVEITLRPRFSQLEQGMARSIVGLYHVGLYYDPIAWGERSSAWAEIPADRLPNAAIRIEGVTPQFAFGSPNLPIDIQLYRVTSSGSWIDMDPGDVLVGEGLGVVMTLRPDASQGWTSPVTGVKVSYSLV